FGSLSRTAGATANFAGVTADIGSASNKVIFSAQPALTGTAGNQILPYAVVTGPGGVDFATQTATAGRVSRFATYRPRTHLNPPAAGSVFKLTAATPVSTTITAGTNLSLNAVLISGSSLTLGGGAAATLTLTGGAILVAGGSNTISVPTVAL